MWFLCDKLKVNKVLLTIIDNHILKGETRKILTAPIQPGNVQVYLKILHACVCVRVRTTPTNPKVTEMSS